MGVLFLSLAESDNVDIANVLSSLLMFSKHVLFIAFHVDLDIHPSRTDLHIIFGYYLSVLQFIIQVNKNKQNTGFRSAFIPPRSGRGQ